MACEVHGNAIVCGHGRRASSLGLCRECRQREATQLCDGPLPAGILHRRSSVPGGDTTCSTPLCRDCAHHVGPDRDFCTACFNALAAVAISELSQ